MMIFVGELHLCPLKDIVQLRPNLHHLDQATAGRKKSVATADANTDNDTTESEGEEAKPVTVRFARRDTGSNRYDDNNYYIVLTILLQE